VPSRKNIVVNAVAAIHSGALSVLNNFIENALKSEFNFLIYTGIPINVPDNSNVRIIVRSKKTGLNRIYWDCYKLNRELKLNKYVPDLLLSLQNTDFRVTRSIPHVVFFHNPFMLYDKNWNFFNKHERTFWFYKVIYRLIVKMSLNNNSIIIVQSQWAKKALKNRGFIEHTIKVFKDVRITPTNRIFQKNNGQTIKLFYPATPLVYKNHKFLFKLFNYIKETDKSLFSRINLSLTITEQDLKILGLTESYQNVKSSVSLTGYIDSKKVKQLYEESDFLIFPSLIETLGLPLIEASEYGMNILAVNLEYAKEVLENYKNVAFLECENLQKWVDRIKNFVPENKDLYRIDNQCDFSSWPSVFGYFKEIITK
jgi:glycosyltransferase involved in cell wall biosynthesis